MSRTVPLTRDGALVGFRECDACRYEAVIRQMVVGKSWSVATYTAPSYGFSTGTRSRFPRCDSGRVSCPMIFANPSKNSTRSSLFFRNATISAPFHACHCAPVTNVIPDGAYVTKLVGVPERHSGRVAFGNLARSVIGCDWS